MKWEEITNIYDLLERINLNRSDSPRVPIYKWVCNNCGNQFWTTYIWQRICPKCYKKRGSYQSYTNVSSITVTDEERAAQQKAFAEKNVQAQKNKLQWLEFIHKLRVEKVKKIINEWEVTD